MCLHLPLPQLHEVSTPRSCRKRRAADLGNRDSVLKSKACLVRRLPQRGLAFFFSGLDLWKHSLPAYINPTNNSGPKSWIVESCGVNFISHHGRVFGTGCVCTNMVPWNSTEGLQSEEGLLQGCCEAFVMQHFIMQTPFFPHSLSFFCLFCIMIPYYAWTLFI